MQVLNTAVKPGRVDKKVSRTNTYSSCDIIINNMQTTAEKKEFTKEEKEILIDFLDYTIGNYSRGNKIMFAKEYNLLKELKNKIKMLF